MYRENVVDGQLQRPLSTCPLFGDGAAAVLVEPTEEEGMGIRDAVFHVDGIGREHLLMRAGGSAHPVPPGNS